MRIEKFEDIDSWKLARVITAKLYSLTTKGVFSKDYGLRDQMQRASVSIMANIAEGYAAGSTKAFIGFLKYSFRSASEVQSLHYVALDCNYITQEEFNELYDETASIKNLIGGFIQYLRKSKK